LPRNTKKTTTTKKTEENRKLDIGFVYSTSDMDMAAPSVFARNALAKKRPTTQEKKARK
jgi:hypothetical protein